MNANGAYARIKTRWGKLFAGHKSLTLVTIVFFVIISSIFVYFYIFYKLPSPYSLKDYKVVPLATHILDRNGKLLYEIYHDQKRTAIRLKDLPAYVPEATIAIEDKDFYHHGGVSIVGGILRAIRDTILKNNLQGGSTITQQLVKGALLTPARTIRRKVREIILAVWTEKIFSKQQILEMYLNQIPYGGAAYGIEEASELYFGKHAKDLTLLQGATLAGLPQAPSLYSPFNNPELTKQRRNEVLKAMHEQKYIDDSTYNKLVNAPVEVQPLKENIKAPHFVFYIRSILEQEFGTKQVEEGGLKVTTSLDLPIEEDAEQILREEIKKAEPLHVTNGAVLVTRPPTGEILAMIGSVDYFASPSGAFNVTTALRQPGSSIKPLNYGIGLDRKLVTPATVFLDVPTCFMAAGQPSGYCPVNYDGKFHGPVQLRFALGNSFNIPAVKMLAVNGVENFIASASAFTITTFKNPKNYGLSLTLGGGEVRMTEMAQAFSTFANRGIPKKLQPILKIQDKFGKTLFQFKDPNFVQNVDKPLQAPSYLSITGTRVISPEASFLISHILLDDNARSEAFGPGSLLNIPKHAVSVKTGTTDDKKDNWTIGFTPNYLTAVWVGNNDNSPMNPYLASGITGAAPIWHRVMADILKNQPDIWPIRPEDVIGKQVCVLSGALMEKKPDGTDSCPARFEYFIKGTEPKAGDIMKEIVPVYKDTGAYAPDAKPGDPNVEMQEKQVIHDMFSTYCVDCNNDHQVRQNIRL